MRSEIAKSAENKTKVIIALSITFPLESCRRNGQEMKSRSSAISRCTAEKRLRILVRGLIIEFLLVHKGRFLSDAPQQAWGRVKGAQRLAEDRRL
jgi:hypothetical protein